MTITGIIAEFNPFHNTNTCLEQRLKLKIVAMSRVHAEGTDL